jgi:Tfp pilus assembly protein PilF
MFKLKPIVLSVTCVFIAGGCASLNSSNEQKLSVEPVTHVSHSASNPAAMFQLGRFYQGQLRHELAIDAYRKALQQAPNLVEAHNALGVIHAQQGRYNDAVTELEAAIAIAPDAAHLHNNLGYAYLLAGKDAEAVTVLEKAQRLDPPNERVKANLRIAYERTGNQRQAVELARTSDKLRDTKDVGAASGAIGAAESSDARVAEKEPTPSSSALQLVTVAPNVFEIKQKPDSDEGRSLPRFEHSRAGFRRDDGEVLATKARPEPSRRAAPTSPKKFFGLEVSNGNGVTGMARQVAGFIKHIGIATSARLTNDKPFIRQATQIEYRHGFQLEASGINSRLPNPVPLVQVDRLREDINVRLVLGRDLANDVALFNTPAGPAQVASR